VEQALTSSSVWASSDDISFAREKFGLPLGNLLFLAVGPAGLFATKPLCVAGHPVGPAPNGTTAGTEVCTEVAAYTIGDAEFLGVPGEVFPYVIIRGFQGPQDMPFPDEEMSPWVMPHASKPFRFIEGLGEDMDGYMFSQNNATAVPELEPQRGVYQPSDDQFGCSHDDDSEAASGNAGTVMARHLIGVLSALGSDPNQRVVQGRYVLSDGRLSRNPIGTGPLRCDKGADVFTLDTGGGAKTVWLKEADGSTKTVKPAGFIDSGGRPQASPNMSTRGIWVAKRGEKAFREGASERLWLDVYADITGAPDKVALAAPANIASNVGLRQNTPAAARPRGAVATTRPAGPAVASRRIAAIRFAGGWAIAGATPVLLLLALALWRRSRRGRLTD
jgi:hypothetical protein